MTNTPDGASLEVRYSRPAIDLAALVACLVEALPVTADSSSPAPDGELLVRWNAGEQALEVDPRTVLSRLARTNGFRALKPGRDAGFFRDVEVPRGRGRAYLGGHIIEGSEGRLQQALDRLHSQIEEGVGRAIASGFDPGALAQVSAESALRQVGERVGCEVDDQRAMQTRIRRTAFAPVGETQRVRHEEIARLMAAVEEVDGDRLSHFDRMAEAVGAQLASMGIDHREAEEAVAYHREQAQVPGTQLSRFFDFLEDEALARIRLHVTFRIMEAIASQAAVRAGAPDMALLTTYVRRTSELFDLLTDVAGETVPLNLSADFGQAADFSLHEEVALAGFAGCLPVWPDWVAQIFEWQQPGAGGLSTREVSYRFRVNGTNPETHKSAFLSRLDRIADALLGTRDESPHRVRRSLSELVFLGAVVPQLSEDAGGEVRAEVTLGSARAIARTLEGDGRAGINRLLEDLRGRAPAVDAVSRGLIRLLKTVGLAVTASAAGRSWDYHINVRRDIVNWQRIASPLDNPLATSDTPERETMGFFRHVSVTPDHGTPGNLFSLRVRVRLAERSLQAADEPVVGQLTRVLPSRWVQVAWRQPGNEGQRPHPLDQEARKWLARPRIEVQYDVAKLGANRELNEDREQYLAAFRCGFSVLVYVALFCVLRRIGAAEHEGGPGERLVVTMLRIQHHGREGDPMDGDQGLFAAAHAVELALSRDFAVRMQGVVLDEAAPSAEKRRGLFGALFAGFPLVVLRRGGGELQPTVGLITVGSRPCNGDAQHPGRGGAALSVVRTYVATAVSEPFRGYRIECAATAMEVGDDRAAASLPDVAVEQIRRLYDEHGCRHMMMLSHAYGSRRIGWAAARMRAPDFPRLVAETASSFPDLSLYPLVRDTFPATRMRPRSRLEDAFEILRPDEHLHSHHETALQLRHAYTPVYSLATLHVVGESGKPQSGFCTYFLLRDGGVASIEAAEQVRANLLLSTSAVRLDLLAVLRGVHYLEAERPVSTTRTAQPVLDPYGWMHPDTIGQAGEVQVKRARRRAGTIVLSLPAVLERVGRVLHAAPARGE